MDGYSLKQKLYIAFELALVAAAIAVALLTSRPEDWQPLDLCLLLFLLTAVGDRMVLTIRHQHLTAAFIAEVLTMTLLGPAPAVAFGVGVWLLDTMHRRLPPLRALGDLSSAVTFLAAGGLLARSVVGNPHTPNNHLATQSITFGLLIFGLFMATNAANFMLVAIHHRVFERRPLLNQARDVFLPLLPGQIAAAALAAILGVAYTNLGYPALLGMVLVLLIFQYLGIALLRSEDRADQLEARSVHLASLQLGVLSTLVETLALRDRSNARHAAAVAHYARELAHEIDCSEADQDLLHTAGLLHDIGKFALPDRILHAEVLSDDDWAVIRRHPQDGATLVGRLDGYGPVAEAILYHHESVDGSGYPAGLIGNEIPLASRILAICSTYDTLTARDTYRSSMTPQDAMAELRRVAGRQLDSDLVTRFIEMLKREGPGAAAAGEKADFEAELAFGRRARAIAQPSS